MTETRAVLLGFTAVAAVLIGLPVGLIAIATIAASRSVPGEDGEVSRLFLTPASGRTPPSLEDLVELKSALPRGMREAIALQTLSASRFRCVTRNSVTICNRSYDDFSCTIDWTVDVVFDKDAVRSTAGHRRWTCL